jgi:hypothetical protein
MTPPSEGALERRNRAAGEWVLAVFDSALNGEPRIRGYPASGDSAVDCCS